ncbi:polysaccharide pyruvyl transferase family protein [Demequina zhanjiangensis]|uniref:Polysaccharide pyruvyl transferase family protein n=1 Tax=Demequina zhanjiangensis TaxID=3051659 RepID=A0ABT8G3R2_9MICO|nr:polysaccharide pyruvyl transferase family protein [Demequina sp. SYSU T00b26]MDN4473792.1 polysaccharide pyruvyl transferase family protein [Demequina sp. SYSU T00b26]
MTADTLDGSTMSGPALVVCSFYSDDEYYINHARQLESTLDVLGVAHELLAITKNPGEDWADICRRKVPFLADVCRKYPDSLVVWMDVDCRLLYIPELLERTTADLIGFQRGFSSPLRIGYAHRTRFWEPALLGIGATAVGREFIFLAEKLEKTSGVKATDDYFFEEAWRAVAAKMSFQVLPSRLMQRSNGKPAAGASPFFLFGSSGSVGEFKEKVVQHDPPKVAKPRRRSRYAKAIEKRLPRALARRLRAVSDRSGLTGQLLGSADSEKVAATSIEGQGAARVATTAVMKAQRGERQDYDAAIARLDELGEVEPAVSAARTSAEAFAHYSLRDSDKQPLLLSWWAKPFPGNYGDWLSPLVVGNFTDRPVLYRRPQQPTAAPHLFSVGSIGRFITASSIVVGTGMSTEGTLLAPGADYVSVRGPLTAAAVKEAGGPSVESFGDPALALPLIFPKADRTTTNGRTAFIRHFTHRALPVALTEDMDELSVLLSRREDIEQFIATLQQYDRVVTTAMHIFITCNAYGIPCALVDFAEFSQMVHGDGMKYRDYSLGAGLDTAVVPAHVSIDLRKVDLDSVTHDFTVSDAKVNEVADALREAVARFDKAVGGA